MLKKHGVDVELFSVSNSDIKGALGTFVAALQVIYNPLARRALSRKLAEFSPDVVHIHNFFPLLSPSILDACRDAGVPSVLTLHNYRILCPGALLHPAELVQERNLRHACWWAVPKRIYRNSMAGTLAVTAMIEFHKRTGTWIRKVDRFVALTEFAKQMFVNSGLPAERITVKPNFVAKPSVCDVLRREGALFVGRLDEQKGVDVMLQAWKDIDCPLRIIGDGPLSELVERHASNRVVYLGRQPAEVVQREMQSAMFLVLPSLGHEMFPVTLLEAFSNHLPVICSDLPSLRELVETGVTGLTFPAGDASALGARVRWAVSNPAALAEFGRHAYSLYEGRYTPEVNFKLLSGIYLSLRQERHLGASRSRRYERRIRLSGAR
ncbi:MAG: glycosyltransferase [Methylobacteriaceae bacterium]|nr:glycosyltransferase [Methylobacteriaceae bacterium]